MRLEHTKAIFTAVWVLAMLAVTYTARTTTASEWTTLAAFTVFPPMVMWMFWNDPPQSMSELIHKARR